MRNVRRNLRSPWWWLAIAIGCAVGLILQARRAHAADGVEAAAAAPAAEAHQGIFNENRLPLLTWIIGIGAATTRALVAQGARVVAAARDEEALESFVADLREAASEVVAFTTDVTQPDQTQALARFARSPAKPRCSAS